MAEPMLTTLRELAFFEDISEDHLHSLASAARLEEFPPGATILREGERPNRVMILARGEVSLEVRDGDLADRRLLTLSDGDLLAWSSLLTVHGISERARAETAVLAVSIGAGHIMDVCRRDGRFGFAFMRRVAEAMAGRLHASRLELLEAYSSGRALAAHDLGAGD